MQISGFVGLAASLCVVSCSQLTTSLTQPLDGDFNPLDGPNSPSSRGLRPAPTGPTYQPGQWVEAAMPNTTFFRKYPKASATADQILPVGTPLKVLSTKNSYVRVELESGAVGYVPTIMVAEPSQTDNLDSFLPPPPISPLEPTSSPSEAIPATLENVSEGSLNDSGDSLIPPPATFDPATTAPPAPDTAPGTRKPSEIVIPTTPPEAPAIEPLPESGAIPPPASLDSQIPEDQIGIE